MGILVRPSIRTSRFRSIPPSVRTDNGGVWFLYLPRYYWECSFEFTSRNSFLPPIPDSREGWKVGIIQNVLFEKMHFQFGQHIVVEQEWRTPVLDSALPESRPFITRPLSLSFEDGNDLNITPYVNIYYGSQNISDIELLDPWNPPDMIIPAMRPIDLHFQDEPSFAVRAYRNNDQLLHAHRITVFKFWVGAFKIEERQTVFLLAECPTFTLQSWLDIHPSPFRSSIGLSLSRARAYQSVSLSGAVRRLRRLSSAQLQRIQEQGLNLRPRRLNRSVGLDSRSNPVLEGITAVERGRAWMCQNDLLPPSISDEHC